VRLRRILPYALGLLVIAGAFALGLVAFDAQREDGRKELHIDSGPNGIAVLAHVIAVDPAADAMTVRIEFFPLGTYAATEVTLSQPIRVFVSTSKGRSVLTFSKGSVMSPTEATVALNGGELLDYPFDKYDSALLVYAESGARRVPVSMRVSTGFNGFKIDSRRRTFSGQGYPEFKLRRATTTIFWALFIDVIFWAVALAALGLAIRLGEQRRKFEAGFTGFLAALLFAFPAVRNALPGNPPIGSLNDFLAFFWTEGVVACALIGLLIVYFVRRLPGAAPPAE
jgi:hypothetical protein